MRRGAHKLRRRYGRAAHPTSSHLERGLIEFFERTATLPRAAVGRLNDEVGALANAFYASTGKKRQLWLAALDTRSTAQLNRLRSEARDYGTASGIELSDAITDIQDMRRRQGRS